MTSSGIVGSVSSASAVASFWQEKREAVGGGPAAEDEVKGCKVPPPVGTAKSDLLHVKQCPPSSPPACAGAPCLPRDTCGTLPVHNGVCPPSPPSHAGTTVRGAGPSCLRRG